MTALQERTVEQAIRDLQAFLEGIGLVERAVVSGVFRDAGSGRYRVVVRVRRELAKASFKMSFEGSRQASVFRLAALEVVERAT